MSVWQSPEHRNVLAVILGMAAEYAPALRAVCRAWRDLFRDGAVAAVTCPLAELGRRRHKDLLWWVVRCWLFRGRGRAFLDEFARAAGLATSKSLVRLALHHGGDVVMAIEGAAESGSMPFLAHCCALAQPGCDPSEAAHTETEVFASPAVASVWMPTPRQRRDSETVFRIHTAMAVGFVRRGRLDVLTSSVLDQVNTVRVIKAVVAAGDLQALLRLCSGSSYHIVSAMDVAVEQDARGVLAGLLPLVITMNLNSVIQRAAISALKCGRTLAFALCLTYLSQACIADCLHHAILHDQVEAVGYCLEHRVPVGDAIALAKSRKMLRLFEQNGIVIKDFPILVNHALQQDLPEVLAFCVERCECPPIDWNWALLVAAGNRSWACIDICTVMGASNYAAAAEMLATAARCRTGAPPWVEFASPSEAPAGEGCFPWWESLRRRSDSMFADAVDLALGLWRVKLPRVDETWRLWEELRARLRAGMFVIRSERRPPDFYGSNPKPRPPARHVPKPRHERRKSTRNHR